ncbi:hypothetical protein Tc00.1047053509545.60 [Trypanosoma cruzi]|uniref:Uncharacterized protein n=1 Tax=Trypanosoma cruzi (strain CL Brener) TaxID=353153 RepID=Q4D179_TRYCC|nr:hypothetical protein Tc00.1047053509545.60 [Trypanosoma cruzi]EAN86281.1 hypothetical protein Tc00.1047053509545.60 [Trypanosoma cruzi]|eukprot:XP_808132.1 hypothetical protein [Trypanosoma cruzi strain CL Brener]
MTGASRCGGTPFLVLTRTSVPKWRISAQARCDSCPLFGRPARALRITRNPLCRWCRSLTLRRMARLSASSGASSRREHRNSLSTSERRIEVHMPNLCQSALFRPQYEGKCPTCSAWRSNGLREPHMRMPRLFHRHPNRRIAHGSPQKASGVPAGKTRRKHKRGHSRWARHFRHRLVTDATGC